MPAAELQVARTNKKFAEDLSVGDVVAHAIESADATAFGITLYTVTKIYPILKGDATITIEFAYLYRDEVQTRVIGVKRHEHVTVI